MQNQMIFKYKYVNQLKANIHVEQYKMDGFEYDSSQVLHLPSILKPDDLLSRLDPANDLESAIAIYEAFCRLEPIQASDARLWTYLTHVDLYSYMCKRWNKLFTGTLNQPREYILDHWFLNSSTQGSLLRHAISGLWWSVHLSIDYGRKDKYELTRILFRQLDFPTRTLGAYKLGRHKEAVIGILEYISENELLFKAKFEEKSRFITKYLNRIGGVKPLSYYDRNYFKNELKKIESEIFLLSLRNAEEDRD